LKASFFFLQLKYNLSTQQKCVNFLNIEVFINENVKIFSICNKAFYIAFFKELVKKTLAMVMLIKNNKRIDFFRKIIHFTYMKHFREKMDPTTHSNMRRFTAKFSRIWSTD